MTNLTLMQIIIDVLKNPKVIVCAVVCMIAMNLSCYIVRYRKKPVVKKTRFVAPAASAPEAEASSGDEDDGGDYEE